MEITGLVPQDRPGLFVEDAARDQGIGRALVEAAAAMPEGGTARGLIS